MRNSMTATTNERVHELTADEIEAVAGGVTAIIGPQNKPGSPDRLTALLPYIEQK